jgi:hypothetical protein
MTYHACSHTAVQLVLASTRYEEGDTSVITKFLDEFGGKKIAIETKFLPVVRRFIVSRQYFYY